MFTNIFKYGVSFIRNSGASHTPFMSNLASPSSNKRIVWIDMEMTGLNIDTDQIIEVACLVTDYNLNVLAEGPDIVLNLPESILNNMNDWCIKQHGKSGLIAESINSKVTLQEAERTLLNFISRHVVEKCSPLAGNTVYMDRLFLRKYMPLVNSYLHYRIIDVSSIKELCRIWNPEMYKKLPSKHCEHRALTDIKESVEELKFYKNNFLI